MRHVLIEARNPGPYTGAGNHTYLVPGAEPALIDAGTGDVRHLEELESRLDGQGGRSPSLTRVLVTHAHPDHASGAPALAERWPAASFLKVPWPEFDERYPVTWVPLTDGQAVPAGDGELRVIHTPGHSPDHCCFFDERTGLLFAGDLVILDGSVMIPGSRGGDMGAYIASLERVLGLGPRSILPAHGPPIDDPASLVRAYIAHRLDREQQILQAIDAGAATLTSIVARVYPDLNLGLAGAAAESVLAHVRKLESEGRVTKGTVISSPGS